MIKFNKRFWTSGLLASWGSRFPGKYPIRIRVTTTVVTGEPTVLYEGKPSPSSLRFIKRKLQHFFKAHQNSIAARAFFAYAIPSGLIGYGAINDTLHIRYAQRNALARHLIVDWGDSFQPFIRQYKLHRFNKHSALVRQIEGGQPTEKQITRNMMMPVGGL